MRERLVTLGSLGVLTLCASLAGCESPPAHEPPATGSLPFGVGKGDSTALTALPWDFPQEQDLAILVPMEASPPLSADLPTVDGGVLLSAAWLDQVSDAYLETDVMDALEVENWYEEWRVVSVRVAPCGPLGNFPGHLAKGFCWPQVRVVWEPVVEDHMLFGFFLVDRYADDRAVHALYRVQPDAWSTEVSSELTMVLDQIAAGLPMDELDSWVLEDFAWQRDQAMARLATDVAALRTATSSEALWGEVDTRSEYYINESTASEFHERLYGFLSDYAQAWALHELTSFSLPAGRSPASIDSWVFVAFDGSAGEITQKDLTVRSRDTGELLVNLGSHQTVTGEGEDEAVLKAMEDPSVSEELAKHVFLSNSDAEVFGDVIADPTQTFVANTTCATCHRLTELTFDFHTFSYFEDRSATISPRVIEDVDHDLQVLRSFLEDVSP